MRRRFLSVILCCACCMVALPTPSAAQEQPPRILTTASRLDLVGTDGRVVLRQISQGSGECALDRLALDLGSVMRFEPAMHDGAPVEVWAEIPLNFRASRQ